jgi:hypothetical protein
VNTAGRSGQSFFFSWSDIKYQGSTVSFCPRIGARWVNPCVMHFPVFVVTLENLYGVAFLR